MPALRGLATGAKTRLFAKAVFFVLVLALPVLSACSGKEKFPPPLQLEPRPLTEEGQFDPMSPQELALWQPDVRLAAWWENGELWVAVRNSTGKPVGVSYANFAVLANKKVYRIDPSNARIVFPQTILGPGEMATGHFQFRNAVNLVGAHCAFNHSATRSSRCVIRAGEPAPGNLPSKEGEPVPPEGLGGKEPASAGAKPAEKGKEATKAAAPEGKEKSATDQKGKGTEGQKDKGAAKQKDKGAAKQKDKGATKQKEKAATQETSPSGGTTQETRSPGR